MLQRIADNLGANRTVMALSMARLGDAIGNSILFVVIPLYVAALPASLFRLPETVLVGITIALYGLVNSALQPFMGALADRVGRRKLFIQAGLLLMGASTLAFSLAADLSSKGGEGRQMSIITLGFGLGIALGPLIAGVLAIHSFELPFLIGGGLSLLGAWVVYHYVPESVHRKERGTSDAGSAAYSGISSRSS